MCFTFYQASQGPTPVNKLDEAIEREVRPWLDLVDYLRAQGIQDELSLPQVSEHCDLPNVGVEGVFFPDR